MQAKTVQFETSNWDVVSRFSGGDQPTDGVFDSLFNGVLNEAAQVRHTESANDSHDYDNGKSSRSKKDNESIDQVKETEAVEQPLQSESPIAEESIVSESAVEQSESGVESASTATEASGENAGEQGKAGVERTAQTVVSTNVSAVSGKLLVETLDAYNQSNNSNLLVMLGEEGNAKSIQQQIANVTTLQEPQLQPQGQETGQFESQIQQMPPQLKASRQQVATQVQENNVVTNTTTLKAEIEPALHLELSDGASATLGNNNGNDKELQNQQQQSLQVNHAKSGITNELIQEAPQLQALQQKQSVGNQGKTLGVDPEISIEQFESFATEGQSAVTVGHEAFSQNESQSQNESATAWQSGSIDVGDSGEPADITKVFQSTTALQDARVDMAENTDRIVRAAKAASQRGSSRIQIRLEPPELGTVRIEIKHGSNGLQLQLQVASARTQQLLQQNSTQLRTALQGSGFQNTQIDIEVRVDVRSEQSQQGQGNSGQDQSQQQSQGQSQEQNSQEQQYPQYQQGNNTVDIDNADGLSVATDGNESQWHELEFTSLDMTV